MDNPRRKALRRGVLLLDGLLVVASMLLAYTLHHTLRGLVPQLKEPPAISQYATLVYLVLPLWLSLIALSRLHHLDRGIPGRAGLAWALLKLHLAGLLGLTALLFVTQAVINRSLVGLFLACTYTLLYAERAAVRAWLDFQHRKGMGRLRLLLIGAPGAQMSSFIRAARQEQFPPRVVGYLDPAPDEDPTPDEDPAPQEDPTPGEDPATRHLGDLGRLEEVLHDEAVDRVLFFPPLARPADVPGPLAACDQLGIPADFHLALERAEGPPLRVLSLYDHAFLSAESAPRSPMSLAVKQTLDVVLAGLVLVLSLPLLALACLLILLTMGRPLFFVQERSGLHGRRFPMWKLRTMVRGAEGRREELVQDNEMGGPVFKVKDDPRVTRLGGLLRRTSVDELPQLFNVLRGDMSLVGPRPLPILEQQAITGWHRRRLSMKPGITGIWQVSGRNAVGFEEWMRMDLKYVDNWSLKLDAQILLRTIPAVLRRRGAH